MTNKHDPGPWRVIIGSARGSTHETRHLPNQDNAGSQAVGQAGGVVAAVADGHGAGRHFRSATGSLLAVRAALTVMERLAAEAGDRWDAEAADTLRRQLPQAIVTRWRELVAGHLAGHPYTADEQAALDAKGDGPEIPYGSTLLVGLVADGWLVCAQIGDGDMLAVQPDGAAWFPVGGDERLDGLHTTSLCQRRAVASFRTAAHDLRAEPLLALQLSTDGYGNAQVAEPWQPAVAKDLAGLAARHDHRWFAQQVPLWAERCASAEGSGDDTTIAVLLAPDSVRLATAAQPDLPPRGAAVSGAGITAVRLPRSAAAYPPGPAPRTSDMAGRLPRARRQVTRRRAVGAGLALVLAAAAVTGILLASQSSGSRPASHPTGQPAPKASSSAASSPAGGHASVQPRATSTAGASHAAGTPGGGSSNQPGNTQE